MHWPTYHIFLSTIKRIVIIFLFFSVFVHQSEAYLVDHWTDDE